MNRLHSEIRKKVRGKVLLDEPLALHTSLRVGGPADHFVAPEDLDCLRELLLLIEETQTPFLVLGGGCNLLVRDAGFRGVIISLSNFRRLDRLPGCRIRAGAGGANGTLVRVAADGCLTGLEFLIGIPGSIGGALSMNAGAHGEAILDRVETLTTISGDKIRTRSAVELDYGYRFLRLLPGEIIVEGVFRLIEGEAAEIEARIEQFVAHRRNAQRISYPNAGSFFKNPEGRQAWRLIDEAGLRGRRIGGAQVSEVHTNFLVNRGGATARDFIDLAALIKEKVKAQSGVELEEEVRVVGED